MKKEEITRLFSGRVRRALEKLELDFGRVHEIFQMRRDGPDGNRVRGYRYRSGT